MYDRVKEHGIKVMQLSELKLVAIDNEDYETAKRIKLEIDKVKAAVMHLDLESGKAFNMVRDEMRQHLEVTMPK